MSIESCRNCGVSDLERPLEWDEEADGYLCHGCRSLLDDWDRLEARAEAEGGQPCDECGHYLCDGCHAEDD